MDEEELDKQFQEMEQDTQIQAAEAAVTQTPQKKKRITLADLKKDITEIEELLSGRIPEILAAHENRLDKIELELKPQSEQGAKFVWDKIDNQDAAIGALESALRSHLEELAATQQEPEPEIVFTRPPMVAEQVTVTNGDIEQVASVCSSMGDVLMICRALKAAQDITDEDRLYLLQVACMAAGVPTTGGLQIRAGMKYMAV